MYVKTNRKGPEFNRQTIAEHSPANHQKYTKELLPFLTGWVKVKFGEKPILVSRRTFSEIVRWQPPTIIYSYTTGVEGDKKIRSKVLVSFHPTTKTYEILIFQPPNSAITTSSTNLDPATKKGQAWIRCLQEAYPYYDFEKAEISPNYQELAKTLIDQWILEQLQQIEVSVPFKEREILVSRRTFSEVARSKLLTIIYNEKFDETTAPNDNQENNQNQTKKIVLVSFHPTTKTYEILIFQSPNGTTTSPTKIDPLTEEGQAWIQCLHLAYSYYNFQQAKIQTEYEHLVGLLQDPSELIGTEQPDRHLQNPDSEDLLLSLPKVVDHWKDKILPFDSNSTILLNI